MLSRSCCSPIPVVEVDSSCTGVAPLSSAVAPAAEDWAGRSLLDALSKVPDPRSRHGLRHPLSSLLGLLAMGFLCGQNTVKHIVIFGRERVGLRRWLGFTHAKCPSQSTYTRLFKVLPIESVRGVLAPWLEAVACQRMRRAAGTVDGKALRGTGQHIVNVFVQDFWCLLDMFEVGQKQNELSAFQAQLHEMLGKYPFLKLLTFDAMFAQHTVVETLTANNRLGIFQIKENQEETFRRLERWFAALPADSCQAQETEKKRGLHCDPHAVVRPGPGRHSRPVAARAADRRRPQPQRKTS